MIWKFKPKKNRPSRGGPADGEQGAVQAAVELRFAYSLLEKLIAYLDRATINMKMLRPSATFSRRTSFKTSSRDIKFFSKVVLPLVEKYFSTHRGYFIAVATATNNIGAASLKEKEMVAAIFCKLASLLRHRFGCIWTGHSNYRSLFTSACQRYWCKIFGKKLSRIYTNINVDIFQ